MTEIISKLRQQLASDQTLEAIDALEELLTITATLPDLYRESLIQRARYVRILREENLGIILREEARVEKNRINQGIIHLLDELAVRLTLAQKPVVSPPFLPSSSQETVSLSSENALLEKLLGINNLKQISWIAKGLACARSVCRVHTPGGLGSGFLVAPTLLMTNNHVIDSTDTAKKTQIEFNYQQDDSGGYEKSCRYRLDATRFHTSPEAELDYTLVGVQADDNLPPLTSWGHLTLNVNAIPVLYEHVSIIQHPNGGLKQIAMTANQVVGIEDRYLRYMTDTMPGSSGSPVFNDLWQVVAIHHAVALDGKSNEGILMSYILADIKKANLTWGL